MYNPVVFFVDNMAIKFLVNKPKLSGRLARWVLLLEDFDYTVGYKLGRIHLQVDHLPRLSKQVGAAHNARYKYLKLTIVPMFCNPK